MPNARIQNFVPNVRASSYQTGRSGAGETLSIVSGGTPIGLLLVLTYANDANLGKESYGDFRPSNRIFNQVVNSRIFNP